ncbi:MAG TPA: DUF4089 domain-containing protein [Xanthobacteraceae bacterium]|nr:DUF4089 domain-containing protein [Xanthobacteraceae bacterium]
MKRKIRRSNKPARARRAAKHGVTQVDSIDALVTASARALGLTLDPAWRAGVVFNLQLILSHAALVDEFALRDEAEPAPVFHA